MSEKQSLLYVAICFDALYITNVSVSWTIT